MRVRRRHKKTIDIIPEAVFSEPEEKDFINKDDTKSPRWKKSSSKRKKKPAKKSLRDDADQTAANILGAPGALLRKITNSPNFSSQLMVIVFSLLSDSVPMTRPLENMSTAIDKARNISEVLSSTMQSVKVATDVPKQIRRLLK